MDITTDEFLLPGGVVINDLPKVSLHDHLDGGLRPQTIIDLAGPLGIELPAEDAAGLARWFHAQSTSGDLVEYLKTFDLTIAVMQSAEALERVAREFVLDLAADGVVYAEVRWAPEQHLRGGLDLEAAVAAVQAGIDAGVDAAADAGRPLKVGQLLCAMRHLDRSLEIAELAVRHRYSGVVGFDIAGPEDGFLPARHRPAFDYLAAEFFPTTVHAGEASGIDSIRSALLDGRALRLGHGVRIAEDIEVERQDDESRYVSLGELAQWVKDRGIALECSPSSNVDTGAFTQWGTELADHPIDLLFQLGFRVTVNTDNRLMSATTLSRELALLADTFGYDLDDLEQFQLNAAEASFLPLEDRDELLALISAGFDEA
ncbi:adenosine deaminase [Microbacteriaceae bacterium VKM Ac-2855]|nr:adenosine deaminase [Microbacteriaceae bacterium VKM Ac-2855]